MHIRRILKKPVNVTEELTAMRYLFVTGAAALRFDNPTLPTNGGLRRHMTWR